MPSPASPQASVRAQTPHGQRQHARGVSGRSDLPGRRGSLSDRLALSAGDLRPSVCCHHETVPWIIGNVPVRRLLPPLRVWRALHQTHSSGTASAVPSCACN